MLLLGFPLAMFLITYWAGRFLGRWPARVCVGLSSLPAGWGWFQFFFVRYRPIDRQVSSSEMATSILVWTLFISCGSIMGLAVARRHQARTESGTGLNR